MTRSSSKPRKGWRSGFLRESTGGFRDRLNFAYGVTVGRQPSATEAERLGKYLRRHAEERCTTIRRP